jgi:hypothetical protein
MTRLRWWILAILTLIIAVVAGSQVAFGYWRTSGSGTGSATTGTLTVTANTATLTAKLYPGGTANLVVNVTNSSSSPVQVTAFSLGTVTGCTTPAVSLVGTGPATIPAGTSNVTVAVTMGTGSSANCKDATLSIPVNLTVKQ